MSTQHRRRRPGAKKKRDLTPLYLALGVLFAILLSFLISYRVFGFRNGEEAAPEVTVEPLYYDPTTPFTLQDVTLTHQNELRASSNGRIRVSDGPRGISIGNSLDTVLERYPSTFYETVGSTALTGEQSNEQRILYCADYVENSNGVMTALPPRGILNVDNGTILVTLLAPTTPYPPGTLDDYRSYEHVFCIYSINPDTMTVASITLGIQ